MCERKEEDCGREVRRKDIYEGSRTGTARCFDSGGCAGEDVEMARDLEDGANTVEFPVVGSV